MHWTEALSLQWGEVTDLFGAHVNPGFLTQLRRLGYDRKRILSAKGTHLEDADGRRILDCWAGFGALAVGHNHPRLTRVRRAFDEADQVEIAHAFVPAHATVLARNLAAVLPGDLEVSTLCCTGSEAIETALKLAEKIHPRRGRIVYATGSMHGLTHGALSVTGYDRYRAPFKLLAGCTPVPYGNADAVANELRPKDGPTGRSDVCAVILEPIQCGAGILIPPRGYLEAVSRSCREVGTLLIVDEVQTGMGRTGKMFAFEHENVVPDVVVISKSLGGGKTPIAACVTRRELFKKAYGRPGESMLHASTFGGMGGACALASETLAILFDERLVDNAAEVGACLLRGLEEVARKHPGIVKDVRGRGLLIGLEFVDPTGPLPETLKNRLQDLAKLGEGLLAGLVARSLLFDHDILVAFTEMKRNVLRLEPPLMFSKDDAHAVTAALDSTLSRGIHGLIAGALGERT